MMDMDWLGGARSVGEYSNSDLERMVIVATLSEQRCTMHGTAKRRGEMEHLKGRIVKYKDNYTGFERYGKVVEVGIRTKRREGRVTKTGRRVKRPTVEAVVIRQWNGREVRVPLNDLVCQVYYGVERPLDHTLDHTNQKEGTE